MKSHLHTLSIAINSLDVDYVGLCSGSMEPAYYRGDILFLWKGDEPFKMGEVVVFKIKGRDIPIVHRILEVHERYDCVHCLLN